MLIVLSMYIHHEREGERAHCDSLIFSIYIRCTHMHKCVMNVYIDLSIYIHCASGGKGTRYRSLIFPICIDCTRVHECISISKIRIWIFLCMHMLQL